MAIDAQPAERELHGMGFAGKHGVAGPQALDDLSIRFPGGRHRRWRTGKSLRVVNAVKILYGNRDSLKCASILRIGKGLIRLLRLPESLFRGPLAIGVQRRLVTADAVLSQGDSVQGAISELSANGRKA